MGFWPSGAKNPEGATRVREETSESPTRWLPTPPTTSSAPVEKQRRRVESLHPQAVRWLRLLITTTDIFISVVFFILITQ